MFWLLLSSASTASRLALQLPLVQTLGLGKRWGGGITTTADPNWPKGLKRYSILYGIMLRNTSMRGGQLSIGKHLSSQKNAMGIKALLPKAWLNNTCWLSPWAGLNNFFFFLLLPHAPPPSPFLFVFPLNQLILTSNHELFSPSPSYFLCSVEEGDQESGVVGLRCQSVWKHHINQNTAQNKT